MPRFKPTPEKPEPGKAGRPSKYSPELAEKICELMVMGHDMEEICEMEDMPSRMTVWRWRNKYPDFDAKCARAREALADHEMHEMKKLAKECTEQNAASVRTALNHFQWRVMKIAPRVYGERLQTEVTGADGGPIKIESKQKIDPRELDDEQREALEAIIKSALQKDRRNE